MPKNKSAATAVRENEARLRLLVEQLPAVVWTTDMDLRFTSAAGAGLKALGLSEDVLAGKTAGDYFGTSDADFPPLAAMRRALSGESVSFEQLWAGRAYHAFVEPWRDSEGRIVGCLGVAQDVTEQRAAELALREAHDALERRVAERTTELEAGNRLLHRLLDLQERDRQLIAYEIHDGLVQDMTGALMFLETARQELSEHEELAASASLDTAVKLVRDSVSEARRLINGLRPPILADSGLIPAIEGLIEQIQATAQLPIEFTHDVQFQRIAPALELAAFRVVQESLNNVWQHSQSPRAAVCLTQFGERIVIEVRDWGTGFAPDQVKTNRYGLLGIRERARLLGGSAQIQSTLGRGTTVKVELPLNDAQLPATSQAPTG